MRWQTFQSIHDHGGGGRETCKPIAAFKKNQ